MQSSTAGGLTSSVERSIAHRVCSWVLVGSATLLGALLALPVAPSATAAVKIVTTIEATQSGSGQVSLQWKHRPVSPIGQKLIIDRCSAKCSAAKPSFSRYRSVILDPAATQTVVGKLTDRSTYRFTLQVSAPGSKSTVSAKLTLAPKPTALRSVGVLWEENVLVASWTGGPTTGSVLITIAPSGSTGSAGSAPLERLVPAPATSTRFEGFEGFDLGASYTVSFTPVSAGGSGVVTTRSLLAPVATVTSVEASVLSATSVQVRWSGKYASGWKIVIDAPGSARDGSTISLPGAMTATVISGLTQDASYRFSVVAVNATGTGASMISETIIPRSMTTSVGAPIELVAVPADREVQLRWNAPTGTSPTGYLVEFRRSFTEQWSTFTTSTTTTAVVTGLINDEQYDFQVSSLGQDSPPASSLALSVTPGTATSVPQIPSDAGAQTPSTVLGFQAEAGTAAITVRWSEAPTGARLQWFAAGDTVWRDVIVTTSPYIISGLTNGVPHTLRFVDADGVTISSTLDSLPVGPPNPASNITITGSVGALTLNWDAPGSDGGGAVTSYRITVTDTAGISVQFTVDTTAPTTFDNLVDGDPYIVSLRAVNRYGESEPVTVVGFPGDL